MARDQCGAAVRFHLAIWAHAESVWREYRSAADYVSLLESEGFSVESGSGEMPTAFVATWGSGKPVIAAYAEYDAVPGNSQQAVPRRAPRGEPTRGPPVTPTRTRHSGWGRWAASWPPRRP